MRKRKTYLYDRWGTTYEDSAWTNEKLEEVVYSSKYYFEEEKEELFFTVSFGTYPYAKNVRRMG